MGRPRSQEMLGVIVRGKYMRKHAMIGLLAVFVLTGCASESRINDYLTGFQVPPSSKGRVTLPLVVGLLIALPEAELGQPTTPSPPMLEHFAERIKKEIEGSGAITIQRIFPPMTIPAGGISALSLERLRDVTRDSGLAKVIVAVATSQTAQKVQPWPLIEIQLFARMDAAVVDIQTGRVLATEFGREDYVLGQNRSYNAFSYPRLYYRTFTFAGPFTIVSGDPYQALGEAAFSGAADQLGMKLRQQLNPQYAGT